MPDGIGEIALFNSRTPGLPEQPTPTPWTDIVLINGWVPAAGEQPPQVRINSQGDVFLRGVIDGAAAGANTQFSTLPEQFRPFFVKVTVGVPVLEAAILTKFLVVGVNGSIEIQGFNGPPGSTVVLTSVRFPRF